MKKLSGIKVFMAVLLAFVGLSLISCENDDHVEPVKLEDVNGNYKGKIIITQGGSKTEAAIGFAAKNNVITFSEFPIKEIVKSVVKDPVKTAAAITALGKIKYDLDYTPVLNNENTVVELTFIPRALEIQIPVDGVNKKAVVTFSVKQKGFYIGQNRALKFDLSADKITVDGTVLNPFEIIKYDFPYSVKN
ncbi:hypothetical protein M2347_001431 [Chryseobacterium sp. H1D6B]|uniref:DUF4840 domain-containing protein n=1 Tax=Chryseobacterium sp. H1D6B TaxID=2940588 RepID=UPI0015CCB99B|nr:DUF4840 domain-containing protein [Chryseobacterium sp. H1D6B]MDH6251704.1 hypothetical protein [Chryseobacterium sp. H1D6B]